MARYSRYIDKMEITGRWMAVDELALELGVSRESVKQQMKRLKQKGLVECRPIAHLEGMGNGSTPNEWRVVRSLTNDVASG